MSDRVKLAEAAYRAARKWHEAAHQFYMQKYSIPFIGAILAIRAKREELRARDAVELSLMEWRAEATRAAIEAQRNLSESMAQIHGPKAKA